METSEYFLGPPGRPDRPGLQASIALAEKPACDVSALYERSLVRLPIPDAILCLVLRMYFRSSSSDV